MKMKTLLTSGCVVIVLICAGLFTAVRVNCGSCSGVMPLSAVCQTGSALSSAAVLDTESRDLAEEMIGAPADDYSFGKLRAEQAENKSVTLGQVYDEIKRFEDPEKFKYKITFNSLGASVEKVVLSEFDDRDRKEPSHLVLTKPIETGKHGLVYSLANRAFSVIGAGAGPLPLDKLNFETGEVTTDPFGAQKITFTAVIFDANRNGAIRVTKTYRVQPGSYLLECDMDFENLTDRELKTEFAMQGTGGIAREGFRRDARSIFSAYASEETISTIRLDAGKIEKALKKNEPEKRNLVQPEKGRFLWAADTNKYFAAIVHPKPDAENKVLLRPGRAQYFYPPVGNTAHEGDLGFTLLSEPVKLAPTGTENAKQTLNLQVYFGPKDRWVFANNDTYRELGFIQTIHFMACCCPQAVISPIALGMMTFMKWLYTFIPNYGVIIIILVLLIRLILHPVTKMSQVSMQRYSKSMNTPEIQAIRKKYAGNAQEMNRKLMEYQREKGLSPMEPVKGMLPMFLQIPIWISLWSSIDGSIDLRGAAFLPVWITDLSMPDALISFTPITIPLIGATIESLNLLPLLMGVAFFLQQQLMPSQQAAGSMSPEMEKQQKMMKIIFPLMFPIMLYKGPSGVNLYIMASTFAGVCEQYVIRKHIRQEEATKEQNLIPVTSKTGGKVKKKKPKPFYKNSM